VKAGEVFFGGDYAERIAAGEPLPEEAVSGVYALGTIIMVSRASFGTEGYGLPDLPEWFPARVCLPPPVEGQWYRWYDPYVWFETDGPVHRETEYCPANMSYAGRLWSPVYQPESTDRWMYPVDVWKSLFTPTESRP
jgi:hypothetical protein